MDASILIRYISALRWGGKFEYEEVARRLLMYHQKSDATAYDPKIDEKEVKKGFANLRGVESLRRMPLQDCLFLKNI
jgi:hypothetical protein